MLLSETLDDSASQNKSLVVEWDLALLIFLSSDSNCMVALKTLGLYAREL